MIAVSKTKPLEELQKAYDCGVRDFGENKVQEILKKAPAMPADARFHMIGHLCYDDPFGGFCPPGFGDSTGGPAGKPGHRHTFRNKRGRRRKQIWFFAGGSDGCLE